ncbi:hypothetical protein NBM05_08285 [Rothia sp. AR01]|uniref:Uncharacterized protein n=2 Tax=Rothia santali TaxID=2949643 RepID=A0A9X2HKM0_9MICC|nr:hypothetical protein [Rothia santali]
MSNPRKAEIHRAMDGAATATGLPLTNDSYSRMGSAAVKLRKEYGVDEMELLRCIPGQKLHAQARSTPQDTFVYWSALCATKLTR